MFLKVPYPLSVFIPAQSHSVIFKLSRAKPDVKGNTFFPVDSLGNKESTK
jgi:hypothetical protein